MEKVEGKNERLYLSRRLRTLLEMCQITIVDKVYSIQINFLKILILKIEDINFDFISFPRTKHICAFLNYRVFINVINIHCLYLLFEINI